MEYRNFSETCLGFFLYIWNNVSLHYERPILPNLLSDSPLTADIMVEQNTAQKLHQS